MHIAAHGGTAALYAASAWFNNAAGDVINTEGARGIMMGGVGIVCAAVVSIGLNRFVLRDRGIGIGRGSRIVRACQMAAFAAPVAAGLVFNDRAGDNEAQSGPAVQVSAEIRPEIRGLSPVLPALP